MTHTSRIAQTFQNLRSANQMAFMPFITSGDPDMETTLALIRKLSAAGVDLIEIGFPYSDPIADGPVIQASYSRALDRGLKVEQIFAGLESLGDERESLPPLLAMVAYAIIFRMGVEKFLARAVAAGFSGLIVPDLPGDEAEEFAEQVQQYPLDLVQLVSPTTPEARVEKIIRTASGFLYCISIAGITGERDALPAELSEQLRDLRKRTDLPLAVGFGISKPAQVDSLRGVADGVIVGSGIVRHLESIESGTNRDEAMQKIAELAESMVAATRSGD